MVPTESANRVKKNQMCISDTACGSPFRVTLNKVYGSVCFLRGKEVVCAVVEGMGVRNSIFSSGGLLWMIMLVSAECVLICLHGIQRFCFCVRQIVKQANLDHLLSNSMDHRINSTSFSHGFFFEKIVYSLCSNSSEHSQTINHFY